MKFDCDELALELEFDVVALADSREASDLLNFEAFDVVTKRSRNDDGVGGWSCRVVVVV